MTRALAWCLMVLAASAGMEGAFAFSASQAPDGRKSRSVFTPSRTGASAAALLVDVQSVLRRLETGESLELVDVRCPEAFDRLRIPGSLNIPLQFIRTKWFLKTTSVVLVSQGFGLQFLSGECERLRSAGFAASVLRGGLCAWHGAGGPLEGDLGAAAGFSRVTPQDVFLDKVVASRLVVDVSAVRSETSREEFPRAVHAPLEKDPAAVLTRLQAALGPQPDWGMMGPLVISETGLDYESLGQTLRDGGFNHVFFLAGGITGYRRYLADLSRLWAPRESRVKTDNACPACGDGDGRGAKN